MNTVRIMGETMWIKLNAKLQTPGRKLWLPLKKRNASPTSRVLTTMIFGTCNP